jgi:hypothetical protein
VPSHAYSSFVFPNPSTSPPLPPFQAGKKAKAKGIVRLNYKVSEHTGRALFQIDSSLFIDDDGAGGTEDYVVEEGNYASPTLGAAGEEEEGGEEKGEGKGDEGEAGGVLGAAAGGAGGGEEADALAASVQEDLYLGGDDDDLDDLSD